MKSKTSTGIMLTLLIMTISTWAFNIRPVKGEGTRLYVDPTDVFAFPSETFTVDIKIADVFSLYSWQVNMSFNPTVLQFVNVTEGEFLKDQPEGTLPPYPRIENELGWVLFAWVTKGKYEGVNGSGTLATVEFLVKGVGETVLNITHPRTYLLKWNPPPLPEGGQEFEDIPCVKENSYFLSAREPRTWYVDDDGPADFDMIQEAIDAANPGDTIFVHKGAYYENVVVDKLDLSLVGEDPRNTVIDAPSIIYPVVTVRFGANNVSISGLTLQNGLYGVSLASHNNTVTENIIQNNTRGVNVVMSDGNRIGFNMIANNSMGTQAWGVYLETCEQNDVYGNVIYGHIMGITLRYSASYNTISHNTITENEDFGIFMWGDSNHNVVKGNTISKSPVGILLFFSSENTLFHNNLMSDMLHADTYSSINIWDNGYPSGGNYWGGYASVDADDDGIGDTPHIIDINNQDNFPLIEPWSLSTMIRTQIRTVNFWDLHKGTENSLTSKLEGALHHLGTEKESVATHKLMGFTNQVEALRGNKVTDEQANYLITEAQRIIDLIEG